MNYQVRPVTKADYVQWSKLWLAYNEFYGRVGSTALDPAITALTWQRLLDNREPMGAFVAEADEQSVGLVHFIFHRSTTALATVCYLQDLITDKEYRGIGVGGALIDAVYGHAKQHGSTSVYWQTHESNNIARKLYDKVSSHKGFIIYRTML